MMKKPYKLFERVGVELEYMLVHKEDLSPAHLTDELIIKKNGEITDELENGKVSWSNELVLHVVELKTTKPVKSLKGLSTSFHRNLKEINKLMVAKNVQIMPTAMHPFLDPLKDLKLWPHHRNEIYEKYNEIFNCKGHGWGNLQSIHINLPFANDEEFYQLHEAIRLILPLLPAIAASSPIYEGEKGEYLDNRLEFYEQNQKRIPSITGKVIPESIQNEKEYEEVIFNKMYADISPYDKEGLLQEEWLNSRGAIARFDRNAIEIRVIDIQECPKADIAIAEIVIESLKWIIAQKSKAASISENELYEIYRGALSEGLAYLPKQEAYVNIFKLEEISSTSVRDIWQSLYDHVELSEDSQKVLQHILKAGSLSERILKAVGNKPSKETIKDCYRRLANCAQRNELFEAK